MVVLMFAALTLVAPDTGVARVPEAAEAAAPGTRAAAVAPPVVDVASAMAPAEPRFQAWRPPALPASPETPRLPLTLDMPGIGPGSQAGPRPLPLPANAAAPVAPVDRRSSIVDPALPDSQQARPVLVDYSDFYYTRLTIHKWASWTMLPLFGLEYYTGQQVYKLGRAAPQWERRVHGPVAATLAGLFVLNTVTGVWNLWDGRKDPEGRKWRTTHGLLMLLADAGFVATGLTAPHFRYRSGVIGPGTTQTSGFRGNERLHKQIAISSMAVAVVSWVMMLPPFRRD